MRSFVPPAVARPPGSGDDRRHDVACRHRAPPSIVREALHRLFLGEHVARRAPIAAPLVDPPQSRRDRAIRRVLECRIERRPHRETALVQPFRAVARLEMLADFLEEVRGDGRRLPRLAADDDRSGFRFFRLFGGDEAFGGHAIERVVAPPDGRVHVHVGALPHVALDDPAEHGGFLERHVLGRFREIQARGGLDAVGVVAPVHLVREHRQDLALRVPLLDLNRHDRFANLAFEADLSFVEADRLGQHDPGELLRQGAGPGRARRAAADAIGHELEHVARHRDRDAGDAQAEVRIEVAVFRGNDRHPQVRRDLVVADHEPAFDREVADALPVGAVDAGDRARVVVVERRNLRQVARVGEDHAGERAQPRRRQEQGGNDRVAGEADDVVGQGSSVVSQQSSRRPRVTVTLCDA